MAASESASLEELSCNNCGAPLRVPASANFVTCNHCRTQLVIRRSAEVSYTEELAEMSRKTDELTQQVRHLTWQNELAALDRDWEREKERYMVSDKHGRKHVPSEFGAVMGGVVFVIMAVVMMGVGFSHGGGIPALFGLAALAIGGFAVVHGFSKAKDYRAAHRRYQRHRASLSPETVDIGRFQPQRIAEGVERIPTPEEYLAELQQRSVE
ncbi:MAG: hypothetical protein DWQ34_13575 [Planctomycetota bacterium]|nr:MAG: hypothetical protein DWQ29_24005 [Planctomycetota bacterium]REJ92189.1 MAG: hypothetical protein DWQ34_13575 [Planctomycetota bacterium]REK26519.1 MAG: hypothetical protein DWQ41_09650 [Planctomycetota bacterium]REK33972.1 MAG: hypothetical protein DWQ45_14205 [Planctomycetota bacterium]